MTRAKEMRDLPLAIDADASGNISLSVGSNLNLDSNLGANSTTAFTSMDGRIFFSNDYSDTPLGANKIVLQNDGNWNSGFGISNNSLDIYTGGDINFHKSNSTSSWTRNITFKGDGKVGIGASAPECKLNIYGQSTSNWADSDAMYSKDHPAFIKITNGQETTGVESGIVMRSKTSGAGVWSMYAKQTAFYLADLHFRGRNAGTTSAVRLTLKSDGKVGIGTTSPLRNFSVIGSDTSSSGYKDIAEFLEPNTTGGTVSVNFGVANSQNNLGKVDFTYVGAGSTDNWVSIGFHSNDNKLKVYANGLVEVASYLKSKKGTIQTVVNQPTIYTSANPVNTWAEVHSNFRVSITPRFASGTKILGTYSIPINPTGAANILMAIQPWYSTNGGTTKTILVQGGPSGSRLTGSHAWFRSSNGYDGNDMQNHIVHFGYTHSATTTLTWGFYFRSEGSNTTYFCQSNGNSSLWGWTAPLYMELREIEIA